MSVKDLVLPAARRDVLVTNRLLGSLGMLAAPMMLAEMKIFGFKQHGSNRVIGVLGMIYVSGWMCTAVGMRRRSATGACPLNKGVFAIQIVGLLLALSWSLQQIIYPDISMSGIFFRVTDAAWPLSHLLMVVVGVLTLRAGVWTGWRRFAPFLVGLALPAGIAAASVAGESAMGITFAALTTIGFLALGYAVRTGEGVVGRP
jgi:uncharacterized membrane protein YhdT